MWLAHEGMVVGWHGPLGPSIAWLDTWAREEPRIACTLGNPGADLPIAPLPWVVEDHLVAFWCEEEGAFSGRIDAGVHPSPTLVLPGVRAIGLAAGLDTATLFGADERGIVRVDVGVSGAPLGPVRRCVSERRAGAVLAAARLRDEALLLFTHRGSTSLGVVWSRGEDDVVVRHPLRAACEDLSICSSGGRAAAALELAGGKLAVAVLAGAGKVAERPHPVLERAPGPLASPRVVWSEDEFTLLAHDRGRDRLLVHPLGDRGEELVLPRCHGPFAAAFWAQHFFALETLPDERGAELRLWRCARDGSSPQQRVLPLAVFDHEPRRARIAARATLVALSDRIAGAQGYRDASARPALRSDAASLAVLDGEGRVTVGITVVQEGVRLRVASSLGDDERLPEAPSSLVRLARWVKHRLSADARAAAEADRACGSALAEALGAALLRFDRAGAAFVLELALPSLPSADALDAWLRKARSEQASWSRVGPRDAARGGA